jgi:hypothetical protein
MASSRPREELPIDSPRKRQKLSAPPSEEASQPPAPGAATGPQDTTIQPSQLPLPSSTPVAAMDEPVVKMPLTETGFQPERERNCAILFFVNTSNPGFTGVLKQRYVHVLPSCPLHCIICPCYIDKVLSGWTSC